MTSIRIEGKDYSLESLGKLSLLDALEVKRQTGMSVAAVEEALERFSAMVKDGGLTEGQATTAAMDDEAIIIGLAANIWIARRRAGETLSFAESANVPLADIEWLADDEDQAVEEAPNPL